MYKNNFVAVIKHRGKILREVDGEVSLPFGSQYSILLKNESPRRVLVTLEVDGENVLVGRDLILEGDTSQEIKGFMRDMSVTNRFKFIYKTKEISDYRGDRVEDGRVRIIYVFEIEKEEPIRIANKLDTYPKSLPYPDPWVDHYIGTKFKSGVSNMPISCSTDFTNMYVQEPSPDEGITVKGSKITQNYQYGDIDELERKSYVITLRLKGKIKRSKKIVTKPLTVKTKLQCSTCGRRSKSSATFCSNCGTYLR